MKFEDKTKTLRPKTSAHLPLVSVNTTNANVEKANVELKLQSAATNDDEPAKKVNKKKDRAKTAKETLKDDDEYSHMFYSRSWRIHPELGIIKSPDPKSTFDSTQVYFYHTKKEKPETFIFHPDWI